MTALPLLLAAALAADPPPPGAIASPDPAVEPAAAAPPAGDRPVPAAAAIPPRRLSLSLGYGPSRYDDIPVSFVALRGSVVALLSPADGRDVRFGVGVSAEAVGGRTEAGLSTGGVTAGPALWLAANRLRAGASAELGGYGVEAATTGITELMGVALLRGTVELDLARIDRTTVFVGGSGSIGRGSGIPIRGVVAYVGVGR